MRQKNFACINLRDSSLVFLCTVFLGIAFSTLSWSMQKDESFPPQKFSALIHRKHSPYNNTMKLPERTFSEPQNTPCSEMKKIRRRASDSCISPTGKTNVIEKEEKVKTLKRLSGPYAKETLAFLGKTKSLTLLQRNVMPIIQEDRMEESQTLFKIYVLLGYPGAGKGTFAEILNRKGYEHLSTGDMLRKEVKNKTSFGLLYQQHIESSSQLLPDELIESFVLGKIKLMIENRKSFILDGYPKTIEQAELLSELIEQKKMQSSIHIIHFDVPLELALERIKTRATCSGCGKIYNLVTVKPTVINECDLCGVSLVHRPCDTAEGFQKRILLFNKTVKNVISYYQSKGSVIKIDSSVPLNDFTKQALDYDKAQ